MEETRIQNLGMKKAPGLQSLLFSTDIGTLYLSLSMDDCVPLCNERLFHSFWSSELSDLKQASIDAHALWLLCDKPRSGVVNRIRLSAKYSYKHALRDAMLNEAHDLDKMKDLRSADNYRPIALSPIISKIFEYCILNKYEHLFISDNLQFGFKKNLSCSHAIFVLTQVVEYFISHGSNVYVAVPKLSIVFTILNCFINY